MTYFSCYYKDIKSKYELVEIKKSFIDSFYTKSISTILPLKSIRNFKDD